MMIEDRDRPVRRYFILLSVVWFAGCSSLSDVFVAHSETAARVGEHELSVATLAEIFVVGSDLPLTRDAVDQLARHWVEVMLVARRSATGDSLFDRTIVLEAMWPTVRQVLIAELQQSLCCNVHTRGEGDGGDRASYLVRDHRRHQPEVGKRLEVLDL